MANQNEGHRQRAGNEVYLFADNGLIYFSKCAKTPRLISAIFGF